MEPIPPLSELIPTFVEPILLLSELIPTFMESFPPLAELIPTFGEPIPCLAKQVPRATSRRSYFPPCIVIVITIAYSSREDKYN